MWTCAADSRPGTFRPLPHVELDAVPLTQIVESLAIHRTPMKKYSFPVSSLMNPNPLSTRHVELFPSILPPTALERSTSQVHRPTFASRGSSLTVRSTLGRLVASYFGGRYLTAAPLRTSVGDMSIRLGRGCSWAMCVERRLVATRSPQNLQRALPGEMWTRCIPISMSGSLFARQAQTGAHAPAVSCDVFSVRVTGGRREVPIADGAVVEPHSVLVEVAG